MAKRISSLFLGIVLSSCLLIAAIPGISIAHASTTWTTPTTVLQPEAPGTWDSDIVQSGNVLLQGGVYRMWFYGASSSGAGIGYATSSDSITWTRYSGNPVMVSGADYNIGDPYVLFINGQYEMWFTGQTKATGTYDNIYHSTSSDGISWSTPVAISFGAPQSWEVGGYFYVSSVTYNNNTGEYRIYYSGDTNRIGFMTSTDGMNWTKYAANPVFSSTGSEGPSVAHFTATYTGSGYDLYYGANFPNGSLNHATSPDGITWTRDADNPFYTPDSDYWQVGLPRVVYNGSSVQIWFVQNRKSDSQWAIWYITNTSSPLSPTNLTIPSPTQQPSLSWDAVSNATSYNIYRNGSNVGSSTAASFTDTSAPTGTDTYYVTAVNSAGESSPSNSVDVQVVTPPAITSAASASTGMRVPFSFTVTTTGSPSPAITESGSLPSGISLVDNGDGTATVSGMAAAGTSGTYPITITASNGAAPDATQSFTLTVTTATSAPTITSANNDTESFGVPFTFTVTTTDYPIPSLTKTGTLPSGVTFTDNGNGTATITGTPAMSAAGAYALTFKAKSSAGTVTQSFTLTITKAPVLKPIATTTAHAGTTFTKTITAAGYTPPALTEFGTLPSGLTFTDNGNGTATIAGTPAVGSGGAYSITITATNAFGAASQTFTLKVNEGPVITSANTATATIGQAFSFQVTSTGYPAPTVTKTGSLPAGITFHGNTHTFSGTAKAGTAGTYSITMTAKNSSGTVTQSFVLVVH